MINQGYFSGAEIVDVGQPDVGINPKFAIISTSREDNDNVKETLSLPDASRHVHILIKRDGTVVQYFPFTVKCSHVGAAYWQGNPSLNRISVGIMLDNYGEVHKIDYEINLRNGRKVSTDFSYLNQFININGIFYETFSYIQLTALQDVLQSLVVEYKLRDIMTIDQVTDLRGPGPLFCLDDFKTQVRNFHADSLGYYVVVSDSVDVHLGPSPEFDITTEFKRGTSLKVLAKRGEWMLVLYEKKTGWVYESFLMKT